MKAMLATQVCDDSDCNNQGTAAGVKGSCSCTCNSGWTGDTCANQAACTFFFCCDVIAGTVEIYVSKPGYSFFTSG